MAMTIIKNIYSFASYGGNSVLNGYNQTSLVTFTLLEGDMVIIIGCIPTLRNHMKLKLSNFGSSVSNLFNRTRSKQSTLVDGYDGSGKYNDLEMGGNGHGFVQLNNTVQVSTIAFDQTNVVEDDLARGKGVRRTDSFTVTGN